MCDNIYFTSILLVIFYNIYFRLLDAENDASMGFFAICCCVFVKPISYKVVNDKIAHVFNDFVGRFSPTTEPRPQKLADEIDLVSSA